MGRKRVLFTQKEISKYSKTYEGRQYMNAKHKSVGVTLIIMGIIFLIISIICFFAMKNYLSSLPIIFILASFSLTIYGIIKFMIYSDAYKAEESAELLRKQEREKQAEIEKKEAIYKMRAELKRIELIKQANFDKIDIMNGFEFEEFCSLILKDLGYISNKTKKSGDFGADIILEKDGKKIVVQTKRYANKVSVPAVQEISTAQKYYQASESWIITNNYFTKPARELAISSGVTLIDRDELAKLINQSKETAISNDTTVNNT